MPKQCGLLVHQKYVCVCVCGAMSAAVVLRLCVRCLVVTYMGQAAYITAATQRRLPTPFWMSVPTGGGATNVFD